MRTFQASVLVLLGWVVTSPAFANPVGWRSDGTGQFPAATPPSEWSREKNVLWKVALPGPSYGAPIVVGENLYLASDPAELLCVHRATGKVLWRKTNEEARSAGPGGKRPGKFGKGGGKGGMGGGRSAGNTAATPVSDGKHIAAVFGNGVAAVYTPEGKQLWSRLIESPRIGFGHAASPLLLDGKLLVHFANLVALDVATGKEAWRVSLSASHASPVGGRLGKEAVVISPSGAVVRARDGKVLARGSFRSTEGSPVFAGDTIVVGGGGKGGGVLEAYRLAETPDGAKLASLWRASVASGERRLPSPVLHDGLVYTVNTGGILEVLDAQDGKQVYRQRLPVNQVYSSIALAGGRLYVLDLQGKGIVFKAGRTFERVAVNQLEGTGSCPVFAGDHLYVRGRQNLYCVSAREAPKGKE